jgi:hypothetical protein
MGKTDLADPDQLLSKLANGKSLEAEEETQIVELLQAWGRGDSARERTLDDLYAYLVVINKANLVQHHRVLERFLDAKDALTVSFVLETLCLDWNLSAEYLERAVSFSIGAPWDSEGDAREQALKILGEHLRSQSLCEKVKKGAISESQERVLALLLATVEDCDNDNWVRQAAYFAICRAMGREWSELPPECSLLQFDSEDSGSDDPHLDKELLEKVRNICSDKG